MGQNTFTQEISFSPYNIGIILMVLGGCLLLVLAISVPTLIDAIIDRKQVVNE